jgi:hypothetical protein
MDISNNIIYDICGNIIQILTIEELKLIEQIKNYYKHHNVEIDLKNLINENLIKKNIKKRKI